MIQSRVHDDLPPPAAVCGLPVRPITQGQLIEALIARARCRIRTCVHYLNTHTFNLAADDPSFREILATSDLLYADGMSVVWAGRWLGHGIPERLSAADYFETFCRRCAQEEVTLFLLGGSAGVSQAAADVLTARMPALRIVGTHEGFFTDRETDRVLDQINASRADVLIVGMGSPRQEAWVARNSHRLDVPVCWSVGALLDYFTDREPRAPRWLCQYGGEWLYRLAHRPRQRWRRYSVGNLRFLWTVMRTWAAGSHGGRPTAIETVRSG